jgi:hypothetical protein
MNSTFLKSSLTVCLAAAALLCADCSRNESITGSNPIIGSGRLVSEPRLVGTFVGVRVTNFAKVFIIQDSTESLIIEADDNILDRVGTSVNNGILVVGLENGSYSNITVNVHATMRTIQLMESVGAADFQTVVPIHVDTIICRITGAGNVVLAGNATREVVEIVGAGNIHNFDLISASCFASISGTGNIDVNVTQQLDAFISGAGTIIYDGHPLVVNQTVTGVGSVRPRQ